MTTTSAVRPLRKLLIANRGEIACRIAATARAMGIRTVAVFSEADANARHVAACDEAHLIGPAPATESYLRVERILEAASASGADAVHPGYGFLAENAGFARACAEAGLIFVGPPPVAIDAMGSKAGAKALMQDAGVPLVPGYHGDDQDADLLATEAARIGYPVLLKASAGGGGKGMRVVEAPGDLADAIEAAKREAASAFGDDRLIVEKYLLNPRHVEMQVFADAHGSVVHLFERDCSVQRRHQKVLEEAPAPGLTEETRRAMGEAAVAAARAIGYVGAGTIEFIMDERGSFHFMEMNTRLQVEHPVTEMITGYDLVEWQLRVAMGEPLPAGQDEIRATGHAIEARLYAEDPARGFLPQTGRLRRLRFPDGDANLRFDTGVEEGDTVSVHYDPMIAKVIAWDTDRAGALRRLARALDRTEVAGLATNRAFLVDVLRHPAFEAGGVSTAFIERYATDLFAEGGVSGTGDGRALTLAALAVMLRREAAAKACAARSADPFSPWNKADGWRLNDEAHHDLVFLRDGATIERRLRYDRDGYVLVEETGERSLSGTLSADGRLMARLGEERLEAGVDVDGDTMTIFLAGRETTVVLHDPARAADDASDDAGRLVAPMPGKVVRVLVEAGQAVSRGARLLVLEAMKMEHAISAPADGIVVSLRYGIGDLVEEGARLVDFEVGGTAPGGE